MSKVTSHRSDHDIAIVCGKLAANTIHDVNDPLGTALVSTQMAARIARDIGSPRLDMCLARTVAAIREGIVGHSSPEDCDSTALCRMPIELRDVIRAATSVTVREMKCRGCRVRIKRESPPALVSGDAFQVLLAIVGLIQDAASAMASQVRISTCVKPHTTSVCIRDDGLILAKRRLNKQQLSRTIRSQGGKLEFRKRRTHGMSARISWPSL